MAEQSSIWQRVSSMWRAESATDRPGGGAALLDPDTARGDRLRMTSGRPWWRRSAERQEAALQAARLAESLQEHFRRQDERAVQVVRSLERVGGMLEQLAETQRTQGECLRAIADHTHAAGQSAAALNATVGRVPEALAAQAEAIRTVARQLEVSQEADTQLMLSLQQFGRAVDTLGTSGTAQVEALQRLAAAQASAQSALAGLVQEQNRRFTILFSVAVVVAVVALAGLGVLVVRSL